MITNLYRKQWRNQHTLLKSNFGITSFNRTNFSYNFKEVDKKWQTIWKQQPQQSTDEVNSQQEKLYILGQFPYPSGNIHMGHVRVYTICDVLTRYYKQKGFNVINPMGWDSFGLPAENAAISKGVSPKLWTNQNIQEMKEQLQRLGFDFDWDRELSTHTPEYYKHTQKIFIELFKKGLAYKKDAYVNWDPEDQTVLANEQIDAHGRSWRSGAKVEKKLLRQWFFKIRDYADEILHDLNHLDKWPETVKDAQRGWIGRSEGANITFNLKLIDGSEIPLTIFTTRPDTIFGATFVALSHESPLIQQHLLKNNQIDESAYERYIGRLDQLKEQGKDLKEIDVNDIDAGLQLRNVKAIHPLTGEELPVYLTSYVLNDYGTGSIMGVPFHDERDCAFALKNNLQMIQVIDGDEENDLDGCKLANSGQFSGLMRKEGIEEIIGKLQNDGKGSKVTEYRLRDWLVSRQRYWGVPIPIVHCNDCGEVPLAEDKLPVTLPDIDQDIQLLKQGQPLGKVEKFVNCKCPQCGKDAQREIDTLDTFVDSSWYFLRFLDSQNKENLFDLDKIKQWMPVDIYVGGMEHAIMHLLYARFIHKFLCDINGIKTQDNFNPLREPFKELIVQGLVKSKTFKLKESGKYIFPEELPNYKDDQLDLTFEKMSKSKGNGVLPDTMATKYGIDTLRLALMFGAPPESDVNFDENFVHSMKQFLDKIQRQGENVMKIEEKVMTKEDIQSKYKEELVPLYQLLLDYQVKINTQRYFHVSIARLMELNNHLSKLSQRKDLSQVYALGCTYLIQALYPFAPHLSSELWTQLEQNKGVITSLGLQKDIRHQRWDDFEKLLQQSQQTVKLRISLDGKFLGVIDLPKDCVGNEQEILKVIQQTNPKDIKKIEEITKKKGVEDFKKVIALKDKPIVNFITK